jgi:hypothetical protein
VFGAVPTVPAGIACELWMPWTYAIVRSPPMPRETEP